MNRQRPNRGFSVVDLTLLLFFGAVLAFVGVLNLRTVELKSRQTELPTNLEGIRTAEVAYKSEYDTYTFCAAKPDSLPTIVEVDFGATYGDGSDWDLLGWVAEGQVRGQYSVAVHPGNDSVTPSFSATAIADMDGDSRTAAFAAHQNSTGTVQVSTGSVY